MSIVDRYRRVIALVDPRPERYVSAGREFKLAVLYTLVVVSTLLFLSSLGVLDLLNPLVITTSLLVVLLPWFKIIDSFSTASKIKRSAEQELVYAVIAAASVSRTGLELSELLRYVSVSRVFRGLRVLGDRYTSLSELFGYEQAMGYLARLFPGRTRLLLAGYTSSLNSGTALYYLRDRAYEYTRTLSIEVDRSVNYRVLVAMLMIVFFGIAPSLLLAVAMLQHVGLEETGEPQLHEYLYMVFIPAIAVPLALALIPDYPPGLSVAFNKSIQELVTVLFTMGSLALITPIVIGFSSNNLEAFINTANVASLTALALGILGLYYTATGIYASKIERAVDNALNHVRVWRSLVNYRDPVLEAELHRPAKPWISDYLSEILSFAKLLGDCDPGVFELLAMSIHELYRGLKRFAQTVILVVATATMVPVLNAMVLHLGAIVSPVHAVIGYAFTLSYGYVASKLVLGRNTSTLIPALTTLLYTLTL
jgi:hypothetical protein